MASLSHCSLSLYHLNESVILTSPSVCMEERKPCRFETTWGRCDSFLGELYYFKTFLVFISVFNHRLHVHSFYAVIQKDYKLPEWVNTLICNFLVHPQILILSPFTNMNINTTHPYNWLPIFFFIIKKSSFVFIVMV